MLSHTKKYLLILLISCLLTSTWAQKPAEDARRSCRVIFPERPNNAPKFAYLFDGTGSQRISLPSMNFSEVIALAPGDITITLTPSEITDTKTLPVNAPRNLVPSNIRDFYIFVSSDPSNSELPLRMNIINTSDGKLKPGETLWFNFTDHRILATLGKNVTPIGPKGRTVSKKPIPDSGYYTAKFSYQPLGKGPLQRITEQNWWHDVNSRHIGLIVNSGGRLPKIYFYRDFRDKT